MPISAQDLRYDVVALTSDGIKLRLTDAAVALGWEEGEDELAQRANITLIDQRYADKLLSQWLPLCTRIYIYADWGTGAWHEMFRGGIWKTSPSGIVGDKFALIAYDDSYYLQKSRDSRFYSSGTNTKTVLTEIFQDWDIPVGKYAGPEVKHDKLVYRGKSLADMISDTLADAKKKGADECVIRMVKGKVEIVPVNSNADVYCFTTSNVSTAQYALSMLNLVTRVIVLGKANDDKRQKVEATLDGKTEYGIIQQTYNRADESLSEAKQAAREILDEAGKPEQRGRFTAIDLPFLRKGDRVNVACGAINGMCQVLSVAHNADKLNMQLEVETIEYRHGTDAAARPLLKYGARGKHVGDMQRLLLEKGQLLPRYGVDGVFGGETLNAVKAFQRQKSLVVDGICGSMTWGKLLS